MIAAHVPGPWAVDNTTAHWAIINTVTGRRKVIGPVKLRGVNYFDRAMEEANRRNQALSDKETASAMPNPSI